MFENEKSCRYERITDWAVWFYLSLVITKYFLDGLPESRRAENKMTAPAAL